MADSPTTEQIGRLKKLHSDYPDAFWQSLTSYQAKAILDSGNPRSQLEAVYGSWVEQPNNRVVQTDDGSFDLVPPENTTADPSRGIIKSADGSLARYTSPSGRTYLAFGRKDENSQQMVYSGWRLDTAVTPKREPVSVQSMKDGYDWTVDKDGNPISVVRATPQQDTGPTLSDDGNWYLDNTRGWQPTWATSQLLKQQEAAAKAQAEAEADQAQADRDANDEMRQYARDAYQTSQAQNMAWRQAQDQAFVGLTNARTQAGQEWVTPPTAMPDNTPGNWINTWNSKLYAQNHPATQTWAGGRDAPVAMSQADAAAKGLTQWVSPKEFDRARQGIDLSYQRVYDPGSGEMRQETDQEYQYRTQTAPMRDVQREGWIQGDVPGNYGAQNMGFYATEWARANPRPTSSGTQQVTDPYAPQYTDTVNVPATADQLAAWNAQFRQAMTGPGAEAFAEANYRKAPRGPAAPAWSREFAPTVWWNPKESTFGNYNPKEGERQIDMPNLAKTGVNPVGLQTWNRMAPSEREGLRGLVEASGRKWDDYMADSWRMAPQAATPTARRKTAVY